MNRQPHEAPLHEFQPPDQKTTLDLIRKFRNKTDVFRYLTGVMVSNLSSFPPFVLASDLFQL